MTIYDLNVGLVYDNVYTKIGLNKSNRSQDIKSNWFLMSNKGRNSVANLRKMTICYSNVALVNDIIFTKGWFLSIHLNNMFLNKLRY